MLPYSSQWSRSFFSAMISFSHMALVRLFSFQGSRHFSSSPSRTRAYRCTSLSVNRYGDTRTTGSSTSGRRTVASTSTTRWPPALVSMASYFFGAPSRAAQSTPAGASAAYTVSPWAFSIICC